MYIHQPTGIHQWMSSEGLGGGEWIKTALPSDHMADTESSTGSKEVLDNLECAKWTCLKMKVRSNVFDASFSV